MYETFVKLIADGAVIPVILLGGWALVFGTLRHSRYHAYTRILMSGLTAYLIAKLLASIFQPELERPFQILGVQPGASYLNNPGFPSDHVLFCTAIVLAVWFETRQKKLAIVITVLTALVALGRILALVHSPLDVFGGVVIAMIGGLWYLQRPNRQKRTLRKQWSKHTTHGTVS